MKYPIEERQRMVLQLLEVLDKACAGKVPYMLAYGSALGAVRHQGFIPWDSDADVLIPITEVDKVRELLLQDLPESMYLYQGDKEKRVIAFDRLVYKSVSHHEVHIDIFPLSGVPDDEAECKKFCARAWRFFKIVHCKYMDINYCKKKNRIPVLLLKVLLLPYTRKRYLKTLNYFKYRYDYHTANRHRYVFSHYGVDKREYIENTVRVPFESIQLPIPVKYDEYLTSAYGDYMTPVKY